MDQFISNQNQTLLLDLQGRGITFHYAAGRSDFHVGHSWGSIHALLAKLRNWQTFSTWDQTLAVWMEGQELHLRFRAPARKLVEECEFSPEETARIMDFLERAPNLN